jgi:16S rRNA (cytosine967-C5)-methyltransferase
MPTLVAWPPDSTRDDLLALGAIATSYSSYGARFDGAPQSLDLVKTRKAGVQDEGSQLVASIFHTSLQDRMKILDLCAGPGGKAALLSHLASINGQELVANEISEPRAQLVRQVIGRYPVLVGDGRDIAQVGDTYDAILADVPCTGIGALRRRPEVRWRRNLNDLSGLISLQQELIDAAISVLNINGMFGYATCSPHFAETSGQVRYIQKKYPHMRQVDVSPYLPENLHGAVRDGSLSLWGHLHNTDSMFLALFEKTE